MKALPQKKPFFTQHVFTYTVVDDDGDRGVAAVAAAVWRGSVRESIAWLI